MGGGNVTEPRRHRQGIGCLVEVATPAQQPYIVPSESNYFHSLYPALKYGATVRVVRPISLGKEEPRKSLNVARPASRVHSVVRLCEVRVKLRYLRHPSPRHHQKMAPMVWQDTMSIPLDIENINFDEIAMLATSIGNFDMSGPQPASQVTSGDTFDSTKLSGDNGVGMGPQPASQEVNLDELVSQVTSWGTLFDSTKLSGDNGVGVGPQPASCLHQPQLLPQEYFSSLDVQPASPEFLILQPAVSEPFMQQTPSLVSDPIHVANTKPASPEILFLQSTIPEPFSQQTLSPAAISQQALSPAANPQQALSCDPCSIQQLDLPQLSASHTSLAASPASLCVMSSSMWQQKQDEGVTLPAPQQAIDAPKKRGPKIKNASGMALSRRQPNRPKVYEMGPLPDEEMEKKRKSAVNAKRHRDMQKAKKQQLCENLAQATAERDQLLMIVNRCKEREQQLLQVLNMYNVKIDGLPNALNGL